MLLSQGREMLLLKVCACSSDVALHYVFRKKLCDATDALHGCSSLWGAWP